MITGSERGSLVGSDSGAEARPSNATRLRGSGAVTKSREACVCVHQKKILRVGVLEFPATSGRFLAGKHKLRIVAQCTYRRDVVLNVVQLDDYGR